MANTEHTQGGTHEQHVKSGEQSHKNTGAAESKKEDKGAAASKGTQGGTHEQHVKAGQESHKKS